MTKRLAVLVACVIGIISVTSHVVTASNITKTDEYVRNRVLLLKSKQGSCSAIEIKAPSGKNYTMSAAHCAILAENDFIPAFSEQGDQKLLKVLKVDTESDLMLLEAFDNRSIDIAKTDSLHEKVHTMTHGRGHAAYRTDGELLEIMDVLVGQEIENEEQAAKCAHVEVTFEGLICVTKHNVRESTAHTVPGSSGGAVLNAKGQLIGIVSCGDNEFSGFVKLADIKEFVKGL